MYVPTYVAAMVFLLVSQCTRGFTATAVHRYPVAVRHLSRRYHSKEGSDQLQTLTIPALKVLLREASLPVSGRKADLIERLRARAPGGYFQRESHPPAVQDRRAVVLTGKEAEPPKVDSRPSIPRSETLRKNVCPDASGTGSLQEPGSGDGDVLRAVSWNVNGLRAVLTKRPHVLAELLQKERPHLLCLQETKLQAMHVSECEVGLRSVAQELGLQ